MAGASLSKSSAKLNLSRRQSALLHNILVAGNQMATALSYLDSQPLLPTERAILVHNWAKLLMDLANLQL
jgi:hypothetical protein